MTSAPTFDHTARDRIPGRRPHIGAVPDDPRNGRRDEDEGEHDEARGDRRGDEQSTVRAVGVGNFDEAADDRQPLRDRADEQREHRDRQRERSRPGERARVGSVLTGGHPRDLTQSSPAYQRHRVDDLPRRAPYEESQQRDDHDDCEQHSTRRRHEVDVDARPPLHDAAEGVE